MCTLTWLRGSGSYELFFNRDELHTRAPAGPPRIRASEGARFIAPEDGDFGGTWIAVNQHGLTVCVLNRWHEQAARGGSEREYRSRGLLVTGLAGLEHAEELFAAVSAKEPETFRPFTLVAVAPGSPAQAVHWDGNGLVVEDGVEDALPIVSSSVEWESVRAARRAAFARLAAEGPLTPARLDRFHRGRDDGPGSHWVCMERPDAATKSISRVSVGPRLVRFRYVGSEPATAPFGEALELPRERVPAPGRGA